MISDILRLASKFNKVANPFKLNPSLWLYELAIALKQEGIDIGSVDRSLIKDAYAEGKDPVMSASDIADLVSQEFEESTDIL